MESMFQQLINYLVAEASEALRRYCKIMLFVIAFFPVLAITLALIFFISIDGFVHWLNRKEYDGMFWGTKIQEPFISLWKWVSN